MMSRALKGSSSAYSRLALQLIAGGGVVLQAGARPFPGFLRLGSGQPSHVTLEVMRLRVPSRRIARAGQMINVRCRELGLARGSDGVWADS
jgi:hypothetical protein